MPGRLCARSPGCQPAASCARRAGSVRSRPRGLRRAWNSPNLSFLKGPSSSSVPGDEVPTQVPLQSSGDFPHCATPFHSRGRLCVLPACQSLPFLFQCEPGTGGQVRQPRTCRLQPSPAGQSPGPLLAPPTDSPKGKTLSQFHRGDTEADVGKCPLHPPPGF